jgi:hypothetical protein
MRNRLLLYGLILIAATAAFAQRISGELRLQVTDLTGAGLHAKGTIAGESVGINRPLETDETGKLVIRSLPPGKYQLILQSDGFAAKRLTVEIASELPLEERVSLELSQVNTTIEVKDEVLIEPVETAQYVPRQELEERASAAANRSIINLVNSQPGWILEANGTLHPRGSEYDVQYVIDGVPVYDNRSPAFGESVNVEEFESLNVRTGGYPAEFGLKLGGVIETTSDENTRAGLHGAASVQEGSFNNRDAFLSLRYGMKRSSFGITADAMATDRYLDSPVQQNFTNRGSGGSLSGVFEREWSAADRTRVYVADRSTRFMVPNEILQQVAGQRQDRDGGEISGQISHTHIFSSRVLGQFRGMVRDTRADLWSNSQSTPIAPTQSRSFREGYIAGSVAAHFGSHELKGGVEGWFSSVHEDVGFHIVNYRIGTVRIFDRDVPQDFRFTQTSPGRTQSAFVQDSWRAGRLTVNGGIRFDHYSLIADESAFSPRVAAAYDVPRAGIVLRASYDRAFQIPAMENVLLASSDLGQTLGGGSFLPLRPSRGNFVEAGFSKSVSSKIRLDGNWYRRSFRNFADDSLLLNTGVSFPIAFSEATIRGFESKIQVHNAGRFSGYVSYSNMVGFGKLPVAGGLFLGDDADTLINGTGKFPISQDQRNTIRSQVRFQAHPRLWFAFASSYNSGLPFEIEGPSNLAFTTAQYGDAILSRVNFDRGRVRPSSSLDASVGAELTHSDKVKVRVQADVFNLANRLNVINFSGVFSGTAVDAPRNFAIRLRTEF